MKIALLLPGLWRLNEDCFDNLNEFILSKHDVDIYVSTWNGIARCSVLRKQEFENVDPKILKSLFSSVYGGRIKKLEVFDYSSNALIQRRGFSKEVVSQLPVFKNAEDLLSPQEIEKDLFWINRLLDQYVLWKRCFDLVEEEYDIYVRHRGDVLIKEFNINLFNGENLVVCSNKGSKVELGDQFAFGSRDGMSNYCSMYDNFLDYEVGLPIAGGGAERALKIHLDNVFNNYIIDEGNKIDIKRE